MAEMIGYVDKLAETEISGWAADRTDLQRKVSVAININGNCVARMSCTIFREDLNAAGLGDGRKVFRCDLSHYLQPGWNRVRIVFDGTDTAVPGGEGEIFGTRVIGNDLALDASASNRLLNLSQERWKGTEPNADITWGTVISGDSFIAAVQGHHKFAEKDHICEIGPGYGRLLKNILERRLPFAKYTGIELSEGSCEELRRIFADGRIAIAQGDVNTTRLETPADLIICSATFEHLFPSCRQALRNLAENMRPGGLIYIDFIQMDAEMRVQHQGFEPQGHAFVRVYSGSEIREMFQECGFVNVSLEPIVLGHAAFGPIKRIFASAQRR